MNTLNLNVLVLAYIGDSVYEIYVRKYLVDKGFSNVDDLQKESIKFVSAKSQASFLYKMIADDFLLESEKSIYHRARNYKSNRHPKNTDIVTYKVATGLEAIIGDHFLNDDNDRINEIMNYIFGSDK